MAPVPVPTHDFHRAPEAQVLPTPSPQQLYEQHEHLVGAVFRADFSHRDLLAFERDDVLQEGRVALWIEALLYEPSLETAPFVDLAQRCIADVMGRLFEEQALAPEDSP